MAGLPAVYITDYDPDPSLPEPCRDKYYIFTNDGMEMLEGEEGDGQPVKQVVVGICAMEKKSGSKPMKEILTRLEEFEFIRTVIFPEEVILKEPVDKWPLCDCLISFHSKGFPLEKAQAYTDLRKPYIINDLEKQYDLQDRRVVYNTLQREGIELPRFAILDRDSKDPSKRELIEGEDHVEVNGVIFNKPFVEKPVSAEDHNIYIYYPTSAGGGSQRLFRKKERERDSYHLLGIVKVIILDSFLNPALQLLMVCFQLGSRKDGEERTVEIGSRSSVYSPESRVRKTGSYIYEDFMPTDGTDVKVYTVGPDYAHAEARKSPALDGKVERDSEGKEVRYPVILSNAEKLIARKVCLAFKQTVCGFDLLRANGKSYVCDVNGFSFVKNSSKYYDDCAKILGNMILRELAPTFHLPWAIPFQLDDPPFVPTTFGKMMELRCVVAVIRHGDRTPKQKMKMEVRHPKFFALFAKYDGYKDGHVKLKKPKQLQEVLDIARSLLGEIEQKRADPETEEKKGKLEQLKSVLEIFLKELRLQEEQLCCMTYGHFSGINRKVQLKYQPRGWKRRSSSEEGDSPREPSLVLILKWGGELTPAGRVQAEEFGRIFRCMYPGGQANVDNTRFDLTTERSEWIDESVTGCEYAGTQGLGLLRLHSTYRHDLKIYASDEGRVQMTAAAFAKGLLALEGELTPILVQMVKSANTNGLLDNDCDSYKHQNMVKNRLHEAMQQDRVMTQEDMEKLNPCNSRSISTALEFIQNPVKMCEHVNTLIKKLNERIKIRKDDQKTKELPLYHGESWELMQRRWAKLEKDFRTKNTKFDISKIPDIYDCIKYDLQHNHHTLQFEHAEELYKCAKYLADVVIPQEYGMTPQEKMAISQGICTPLLKKIRADLQRNIGEEESGENAGESINRLNPVYSHGVSSPSRHVRTRLYFTSESHIHSLLTVLRFGGLIDNPKDEQWSRAMDYIGAVSELNYLSQIVVMLYEDPTKDPSSDNRFHVELHFSPGVNCCVHKNLPPGPGFRPKSRNEPPLSPKAEAEMRRARATSRIDEEDLQYILEEMCEGEKEGGLGASLGERVDSQSRRTSSSSGPTETRSKEGESKVLLSPPTKDEVESYAELPSGVLQPGGVDAVDGELVIAKSEPIPISARSHSDCGLVPLGDMLRPYPITRSLSDGASSYQRSLSGGESVPRPRSLEADNVLNQDSTPRPEKAGSSSLDSLSEEGEPSSSPLSHCPQNWSTGSESMKRHRHSIPGHLSYLSFLAGLQQKATAAVPVFSTAVISGSTSAPDLRDNFSALPFSANLEGLGGVPSIRPLETLHNALALRQLDAFLERMALAQFRTPLSSPPKMPSTPRHPRTSLPLGLQSPSSSVGWSGPPSFVSSSGPSSPNINTLEFFSHQHRCYDTNTPQPASPKFFSTAPSLTTTTTTTITTAQHEHAHYNNPYTARAPDTYAANDRGVFYAEVNAAAVRFLLQLNTSTKPHPDTGLPDFSAQHANVDELSSADGGVGAVENSGEMSDPASPSEGSESLGSHSQTEVASIIERGDTATPDTHSDVQDQEISCQETTEPENLLSVTNNRGAASSE
ncbi:inositol hexakisphosphate and diphosphoinositol-pentakisphosphate kinase 2-like isoform X8 [Eriocheir sinensis]|uniref:inositol hexakisphosphate and diphosphoinositol-pentakisphosphate kinase 2-like isoform X8 n=1 Tax=Eriocheir sinensis TaxID=95602 RepID=UPI0021C686B9|nr:inositol hexakisphosphate and diphosphoinositol-pentakisphosphate kinase 2-like isoform X8 [Eriocheir sinensis]